MLQSIEHVASLRSQLWDCGFRPVPVLNADKVPIGRDWGNCARKDPPDGVRFAPVAHALNTGLLCDGLRAIDLDIDDVAIAALCRAAAVEMFGETAIRTRRNSPRCLLLYRAAEDAPTKVSIVGVKGKVEVLGRGQQFVAFGTHPSGADLEWFPDAPGQEKLEAIPAVTEVGIFEYLRRVAPIIGSEPPKAANGHDHAPNEPQADRLRIAAAMAGIGNGGPPDWEWWNRTGMAVWAATGGGAIGLELFDAWSARNAAYDPAQVRERWAHYAVSPPSQIGAGTIFHLARETRERDEARDTGRTEPPEDLDPGYWEAQKADAARHAEPPQDTFKKATAYGVSLWVIREAWQSKDIPIRPWIARGYLMRRSITVVSGAGAAGKSSLMIAWATALTVGCAFRNLRADGPIKVATYNVEDDEHEQKRRFSAMLSRLKLAPGAFADRLAILGPAGVGTLLTVGRDGGVVLNTTVMNELETFVNEFKPDVLMLDPFVELHGAEENDNTAVRAVLARFRAMAIEHDMAIVILHHARKGNGDPGDPDTLRGASSIVGAARIVLTVAIMAKDEAEKFGIAEKHQRLYFRLDGAKSNYAAPEEAEWFERLEITLDNGGDNLPADRVAVAWPWKPPTLGAGIPSEDLNRALDIISEPPAGWLYAPFRRGKDQSRWAGKVICNVTGCTERQAADLIKAWLSSGLLVLDQYQDEHRHQRDGVRVVDANRPT